MPFDLLIRGGTLVDGTGTPGRPADVGVTGDRITAVGDLSMVPDTDAATVITAEGHVVAPGFVLTEQLDANMPQQVKDWMLKGARSTRHGAPRDIAGAVAFLLSDDGEWVNGQVWRVNGGVSFAN